MKLSNIAWMNPFLVTFLFPQNFNRADMSATKDHQSLTEAMVKQQEKNVIYLKHHLRIHQSVWRWMWPADKHGYRSCFPWNFNWRSWSIYLQAVCVSHRIDKRSRCEVVTVNMQAQYRCLPPTRDAVLTAILRAHYQAMFGTMMQWPTPSDHNLSIIVAILLMSTSK